MSECATDRTNRADVPPRRQFLARASAAASRHQAPATAGRWGAQTRLAVTAKALILTAGLCLPAAKLAAQPAAEPAPAAETPIPEPQPVVGSPPAPEPTVHVAAPAAEPALAEPKPVSDPEPVKAPPKPAAPSLKIGMGVRTGLSLSLANPTDDVQLYLDDGLADQITIRPYFSAQLTERIGVVANFDIETSGFNLLDGIIQLKVADEFQIWAGQHIPAQDRNNFCGPYFNNSWNFAIHVHSYPFDFGARDRGFTFWGLIAGGILKYHLSMVDLQPGGNMTPGRSIGDSRFGGRVTLNLLDPENYYYSSGTYYGAQDTLALGAAFQYQHGVTGAEGGVDNDGDGEIDSDFLGFSFDALFEKRLGDAGTLTFEAGYWNFEHTGPDYVVNQGTRNVGNGFVGSGGGRYANNNWIVDGQSLLGAVSWLTPGKIGIGHLQPNFRVQWANEDAGGVTVIDVGLAYVIDGFNNRWHLNYRHIEPKASGADSTDMIQVGAQLQI
jgi:hypothetical protein